MTNVAAIRIEPDFNAAKQDAQRNIANARIWAFEDECKRLGAMLAYERTRQTEICDFLYTVAEANGLVIAHGDGLIHKMIVAGLEGGDE
ncbi:hypothetical protein FNL56_16350 [Tardiphaga sp. vice304]|uniref:hypothetical protein n=1 Tax=Tardiphaga sp. vice304 TaxID=2592817 RepID=UPI001163CBF5|nr:hypothetical protein [Tardiphaga sp. vice304]QDM27517.1 hypothetical protein FNL56_16350 [Tardiphaga sp. vice304]